MARPKKNSSIPTAVKLASVPGVVDIITETDALWDVILKRFQKLARIYGFSRIYTGVVEDKNLYSNYYKRLPERAGNMLASEGAGRQLVVPDDFLPSVLRAYYQNKVFETTPLSKWFYGGFTATANDKKQITTDFAFGFEIFGAFTHLTEAQVLSAVWHMVKSLGLEEVVLEINNIGQSECQEAYQETLRDFLKEKKFQLCDNCNEHLQGRTLNVFRCDEINCQAIVSEAPAILDFLDPDSHQHFTNILEALDELQIPYQLNPLYAGPEGYSKTNVVIKYKSGSETYVLGEAGYHEDLMQAISGKKLSCFGFSGSLSKIRKLLELARIEVTRQKVNDVFLVPLGDLAAKKSLRLFRDLTTANISVYDHFGTAGVKNQLKQAETDKSPIALIMGQKEAMEEMVILRDVKSGMQEIFSYDKIVEEVRKRLGK
jgi:histidyl-tRNA synthetase